MSVHHELILQNQWKTSLLNLLSQFAERRDSQALPRRPAKQVTLPLLKAQYITLALTVLSYSLLGKHHL